MMIADNKCREIQDNMFGIHRRTKSLEELVSILESGFEAINDDNCSDILSALLIIKDEIGIIGSEQLKNIKSMDSLMEEKGV